MIRTMAIAIMAGMTAASYGAWSPVVNLTDLQDVQLVKELTISRNEHALVSNNSTMTVAVAGMDLQDKKFWTNLQVFCDNECVHFLNHTSAVDATNGPAVWTLTDVRAYIGWTNTWRRATTWPTDWTDYGDPAFSYGYCTAGDIIGPWLWVDAQNFLDALRWTKHESPDIKVGSGVKSASTKKPTDGADAVQKTAYDEFNSNWGSSWTAVGEGANAEYFFKKQREFTTNAVSGFTYQSDRGGLPNVKAVPCISTNWGGIWPNVADIQFAFDCYFGINGSDVTYADLGEYGWTNAFAWTYWSSGNSASGRFRAEADETYTDGANPMAANAGAYGVWDETLNISPATYLWECVQAQGCRWVVKWSFTYKSY